MRCPSAPTPERDNGTWYLAQVAEGVWRIHARAAAEAAPHRVLDELAVYPAVVTADGNLFYLGTSLIRLVTSRSH